MSKVVFVCTANQCRSPIAEHLFRTRLATLGVDWEVTSAGTAVPSKGPMHEFAASVLREQEIEVSPTWSSRPLTGALARDASLILTATHGHLRQTLALAPQVAKRAFVLGQFAWLVSAAPSDAKAPDVAELVDLAVRSRTLVQPRPAQLDDLDDPIGGTVASFRSCLQVIDRSLEPILTHISVRAELGSLPSA